MRILILGSGGREHALAWKLAQSPRCKALFAAPGNSGTAAVATNLAVDVMDFASVKKEVLAKAIDMVVVGPEGPLVGGIHDYFLADDTLKHLAVIGPQKAGAMLEGSKAFAKKFLCRHDIPTAAYKSFTKESLDAGKAFLETLSPPYVLKADGLAAGKGVLILKDLEVAKRALEDMLVGAKFGTASARVVIEEFLEGIELSCFVLTDGMHYKILPMAKDYKRLGEGDTGPNTGGMGAVSPVPFVSDTFRNTIEERIVKPTIDGLKKDGIPYTGFLFIGLIKDGDTPKVIEYNVRLGDPETEVVLPRLNNDLVELLKATADKNLDTVAIATDTRAAATVVVVSGGYPEAYEKGRVVTGIDTVTDAIVFHAGMRQQDGKVLTSGGRVMAVTSYGATCVEALEQSYRNIEKLHFDAMAYRKDIGFDL